MKTTEARARIRALSTDQMQDELIQLKKEQFNMRFQRAAGQLEATGRVKTVRRSIARIKTVMSQPARVATAEPKKVAVKAAPAKKKPDAEQAAEPSKAKAKRK